MGATAKGAQRQQDGSFTPAASRESRRPLLASAASPPSSPLPDPLPARAWSRRASRSAAQPGARRGWLSERRKPRRGRPPRSAASPWGQAGRAGRWRRVQPVPWVWRVAMRGPSRVVSPSGVIRMMSMTESPGMWPPFIATAPDTGCQQRGARGTQIVGGGDGEAGQGLGLRRRGGDEIGAGDEPAQGRQRVPGDQRRAAFGHHHRIDDERDIRELGQGFQHHFDRVGLAQHAGRLGRRRHRCRRVRRGSARR